VSYFTGPSDRWQAGLPTYAEVVYREVWPGIDLSVAGTAGRMEYTFTVAPGADPRRIRMRYRGASSVRLDRTGALDVTTPYSNTEANASVSSSALQHRRMPMPPPPADALSITG